MQILWHSDTKYPSGIEYFGLARTKKTATISLAFPISTLMLRWPPYSTTINTSKPHLGGGGKAQIKTVTTVVIKITIQNILCITEIALCPGWILRSNNISLYTIHIKHTQDARGVQFFKDSPSL